MKTENVKFLFHVIQTFFKKHPDLAWAVTLLFLPPLGIYGVCKYTQWSRWLKIGLSVYATAWTVGVLISSQQEIQSSKLKVEDSSLSNTSQNPSTPNQNSSVVTSISKESTARQIGDYFEYKYGVRRDTGTQYVRSPEEAGIIVLRDYGCQLDVTGAGFAEPTSLDRKPSKIHLVSDGAHFQSICAEILQEVLATYIPNNTQEVYSQATDVDALTQWRDYQSQHDFEPTILFENSNVKITATGVTDAEMVAVELDLQPEGSNAP